MEFTNVNITLANGQLGAALKTADGVVGMVLTGETDGSFTQGTPYLFTSLADAETQGLTSTGNAFAHRQVKEFYDEAPIGTQLYFMILSHTSKVNDMADKTNANGAIKLLNYAAGKIRVLGVMTNDSVVYPGGTGLATTHAINADCYTAISNMQLLANQFFAAQKPFRGIVGGTSFTGTATDLNSQTTSSNNRVSCLIGDTQLNSGAAALGLLLGRVASIPVQRKDKQGEEWRTEQYHGLFGQHTGRSVYKYGSTV